MSTRVSYNNLITSCMLSLRRAGTLSLNMLEDRHAWMMYNKVEKMVVVCNKALKGKLATTHKRARVEVNLVNNSSKDKEAGPPASF